MTSGAFYTNMGFEDLMNSRNCASSVLMLLRARL